MATLKQRLRKKNSSGSYDTVHLETSASMVLMSNGTTVEAAVNSKAASDHTHTGYAASSHNHAASNITSGTLDVARGGTGVTSSPSMLTNLASTTAASVFAASPRPGVTGTLPVGNGGTGVTTLAALKTALGISGSGGNIACGSYSGTGKYGASNPNSIAIGFVPKILIMYYATVAKSSVRANSLKPVSFWSYDGDAFSNVITEGFFDVSNLTSSYSYSNGFGYQNTADGGGGFYSKISGTTIYWYCTYNNSNYPGIQQLNCLKSSTAYTYYWIAIG